jgi:hypothetical protein
MRRLYIILLFFIAVSFAGHSQSNMRYRIRYAPVTSTIYYRLGESIIPIKIAQYGDSKDVVYINLHADEYTSVQAAEAMLRKEGGFLIKLENNNKRNIRFKLKGAYYTFDPNRIFSRHGVYQTLATLGRVTDQAIEEVQKFAARLLELIPGHPSCIIALHNNTDGRFGVNSYLPGAERQADAIQVYADPAQDPDDIFFTTDSVLYQRLAGEKFNTILQDNDNAWKDGSLSVYCGERSIPYINCETQHGKTSQYLTMLMAMATHIERVSPGSTVYNYAVQINEPANIGIGDPVYFGDRKIGTVLSVNNFDVTKITGRLEINKAFKVYSNMDFFIIGGRIEVRIDPTRAKMPVTSSANVISLEIR